MKKEFNVGDKVTIRKDLVVGKKYGKETFVKDMQKMKGKTVTIRNDDGGIFNIKEYGWNWTPEMFVDNTPDKLIFNGNATILIKDGEKYVSKCADGDTYDKEKGLLLCLAKANGVSYEDLQKMIDGAEDKNKEAAEKAIKNLAERMKVFFEAGFKALKERDNAKPEAENTVKEVYRHAKKGEYIKIVNAMGAGGFYERGDVLKVLRRIDNVGVIVEEKQSKNGQYLICDSEYVVLENYKPYKITLSEFWKSEDKLAIQYKNDDEGQRIFDLMIKKGFCCKHKSYFRGYGVLLNKKNCVCVAIDENNVKGAKISGYKIYKADEVDLNN